MYYQLHPAEGVLSAAGLQPPSISQVGFMCYWFRHLYSNCKYSHNVPTDIAIPEPHSHTYTHTHTTQASTQTNHFSQPFTAGCYTFHLQHQNSHSGSSSPQRLQICDTLHHLDSIWILSWHAENLNSAAPAAVRSLCTNTWPGTLV